MDSTRRILIVVANPSVSTTTGWPVGFWASELIHPYDAFTRPEFVGLLEHAPSVANLKADDFDAVAVVGGQAPMFTFKDALALQRLFLDFFNQGKVSAALCHGTALLLYLHTATGEP